MTIKFKKKIYKCNTKIVYKTDGSDPPSDIENEITQPSVWVPRLLYIF